MPDNGNNGRQIEITISWPTILKVLAACLLAYLAVLLSRFILLLLLALLIAIAFRPLLQWTAKRRWPKWVGVLICALLLFGLTGLVFGILIPTISDQGIALMEKLPAFKQQLLERMPQNGAGRLFAEQLFSAPAFSDPQPLLKRFVAWSSFALERLAEFFVVLIVALYCVANGERVYQWLVALLPEKQRKKVAAASDEATSLVSRFVAGNVLTSILCGGYGFIVLTILGVPNAALLAVLAAILDLLPLIGFFLFTITTMIVAYTLSPVTAGLVGVLYGVYHLFEVYYIVPVVYGNRLRLSSLTVIVASLAGALVAGVVGMLVLLLLVACYPIIERIWLRPYLEQDTVAKHEEIDKKG